MRMGLLKDLMQAVSVLKGDVNTRKKTPKVYNERKLDDIVAIAREILGGDKGVCTNREYIDASRELSFKLSEANPRASARLIKRVTLFVRNMALYGAKTVSVRRDLNASSRLNYI